MAQDWFDKLCADRGLRAATPVVAKDVRVGQYMFTANGSARQVTRRTLFKKSVRLTFSDGWVELFEHAASISLIANAAG